MGHKQFQSEVPNYTLIAPGIVRTDVSAKGKGSLPVDPFMQRSVVESSILLLVLTLLTGSDNHAQSTSARHTASVQMTEYRNSVTLLSMSQAV